MNNVIVYLAKNTKLKQFYFFLIDRVCRNIESGDKCVSHKFFKYSEVPKKRAARLLRLREKSLTSRLLGTT